MKLLTNLPKDSIESINFIDGIDGESGWFIYLNNGWSFDPMANDTCCFIGVDAKHDAKSLSVYKVEA